MDRDVHLVYTQLDEALPLAGPPAAIPAKLLALLPAREQGRIELRRVAAEGSSRPKPPRAPVPAALAPAPDRFDVDSLVAALSRPTSFGEAGVSGWQRAALPDGTLQAAARYHQKLYEVQADRVAVVVQLDPGRNHTIAGAALACRRLNDAVFGRNSMAANHAAMELLYAIGTGSGRRMLERKISGRRLTAQRLAGRDQVLFAIHSR